MRPNSTRRSVLFLLAGFLLFSGWAQANVVRKSEENYAKYFRVDLDKKLPFLEELQGRYFSGSKTYDRKFKQHWSIGNVFDEVFKQTIVTYGTSEKRIKGEDEESLLAMIQSLPPDTYQYIGPLLHEIPSMSDKILNMPGIKETKNKFPTRIAPQVQHIEDLEFLPTYMYVILMPEVWPENANVREYPMPRKARPAPRSSNDKLMEFVKALVPPEDFAPNAEPKASKFDKSNLRTLDVTETSPLTSADVRAFANSLASIGDLVGDRYLISDINQAGTLLDLYEQEQGNPIELAMLKDIVNPCQRLVQKMRLIGRETELLERVSKDGFDLKSWAYTCDKTIKAYRMSFITSSVAASLTSYKKGLYDDYMIGREEELLQQKISKEAIIEMYNVPISDLLEVKKNKPELNEAFKDLGFGILSAPVVTMF